LSVVVGVIVKYIYILSGYDARVKTIILNSMTVCVLLFNHAYIESFTEIEKEYMYKYSKLQ